MTRGERLAALVVVLAAMAAVWLMSDYSAVWP